MSPSDSRFIYDINEGRFDALKGTRKAVMLSLLDTRSMIPNFSDILASR